MITMSRFLKISLKDFIEHGLHMPPTVRIQGVILDDAKSLGVIELNLVNGDPKI
jgi:hypothetical protein